MKMSCEMAMDLADVYFSGNASEDTKNAVKEHLAECSECRKFYDGYSKGEEKCHKVLVEACPDLEDELISDSMDKISKRLRRRKIISDSVKIFCLVVTIVVGIASLVFDIMNDED